MFVEINVIVKVNVGSRYLSVGSIIFLNLTWIDGIQILTESRIVQWQSVIFIAYAGIIKGLS
jgi:hypothetical protein